MLSGIRVFSFSPIRLASRTSAHRSKLKVSPSVKYFMFVRFTYCSALLISTPQADSFEFCSMVKSPTSCTPIARLEKFNLFGCIKMLPSTIGASERTFIFDIIRDGVSALRTSVRRT